VDPSRPAALNKLRWSPRGDEILVGSSDGRVHAFSLAGDPALLHLPAEGSATFHSRYC
jgi:hypothetical protein